MRVVAGEARGRRLAPVPAGTRPVSDRAREGLFSSLGAAVSGALVLDLYAGTGALGIEALSRGAREATFVDRASGAVRTIRENLERTRLADGAVVLKREVLRFLQGSPEPFDLVFLDPPYDLAPGLLDRAVGLLPSWLSDSGAMVVLTRHRQGYTPVIPIDWLVARRLEYGDSLVLVHTSVKR